MRVITKIAFLLWWNILTQHHKFLKVGAKLKLLIMKNLLFLLLVLFLSCKKNSTPTNTIIDKEHFIAKTKQLFGDKINSQNGIVSTIDFNSTSYREMEVNGKTHQFYYTKSFSSDGKENGGLISLILPNKKVFNCFVESINNTDGSFTNYYSDFSNSNFGQVSVSKGEIVSSSLGLPKIDYYIDCST